MGSVVREAGRARGGPRGTFVGVLVALLAMNVVIRPHGAEAQLATMIEPPDRAALATFPNLLQVGFDRPIRRATLALFLDGRRVAFVDAQRESESSFRAFFPPGEPGEYVVEWEAVAETGTVRTIRSTFHFTPDSLPPPLGAVTRASTTLSIATPLPQAPDGQDAVLAATRPSRRSPTSTEDPSTDPVPDVSVATGVAKVNGSPTNVATSRRPRPTAPTPLARRTTPTAKLRLPATTDTITLGAPVEVIATETRNRPDIFPDDEGPEVAATRSNQRRCSRQHRRWKTSSVRGHRRSRLRRRHSKLQPQLPGEHLPKPLRQSQSRSPAWSPPGSSWFDVGQPGPGRTSNHSDRIERWSRRKHFGVTGGARWCGSMVGVTSTLPNRRSTAPVDPGECVWEFPDARTADDDGLVAIGADLAPATLVHAYRNGTFPWPHGKRNLPWFSPNPRGVLPLDDIAISKTLRQTLRRSGWTATVDTAFGAVIDACSVRQREGTWITPKMRAAYMELHAMGWTHSVEIWDEDNLVGGCYGVLVGGMFIGESMFHRVTDASKVALVELGARLRNGGAGLIDVQLVTDHLASMGARPIPRALYLELLVELRDDEVRLLCDRLPVSRHLPVLRTTQNSES